MPFKNDRWNRFPLSLLLVLVIPVAAAVDISGLYTATVAGKHGKTTSLELTLAQQGTSLTGTLQVTGTPCFTSLGFVGSLNGNVLTGAATDAMSRIDIQLTASGDQLAGTYNISAGPCTGLTGMLTFTQAAAAATPTPNATPTPPPAALCAGDCNGDGMVTVNELLTMVNIGLGTADVSTCRAGDTNVDGMITINEVLAAVNNALNGCPGT